MVRKNRVGKYDSQDDWNDLKTKIQSEGFFEVSEKIGQFKMMAKDGKMRQTDVTDTKTLLRIIQTA